MSAKTLILIASTIAFAAPAAADAATITRDPSGALVYTAAPGETNHVDVSPGWKNGWETDPSLVVFMDTDAVPQTVTADGCVAVETYETQCRLDAGGVRVSMGDGNDRFTSSADLPAAMPLAVDGGPGDDRLSGGSTSMPVTFTGGDGNDSLTGGPGADTLDGGAGNDDVDGAGGPDTVLGGAGDDILHGDHFENPAPDVIDGGPGTDVLQDDYASRFTDQHPDVSITLDTGADDGRPGEGDDLRNVEQVIVSGGGQLIGTDGPELLKALSTSVDPVTLDGKGGNDTLDGGGGDDTITGGPGDDAINAGYGNDTIVGGPGRDVIHADLTSGGCGPVWCDLPYGNDTINVRDGEVDTVDCGFGTDSVIADPQDMISSDCENVDRRPQTTGGPGSSTPPSSGGATGGSAGSSPTSPHPVPSGTPTHALARLAVVGRPRLGTVISRGLLVRVAGRSGRVTVTATIAHRGVGRGTGISPVGVRLTRAAAKRLRHARRATIVLSAAGARTEIRLSR